MGDRVRDASRSTRSRAGRASRASRGNRREPEGVHYAIDRPTETSPETGGLITFDESTDPVTAGIAAAFEQEAHPLGARAERRGEAHILTTGGGGALVGANGRCKTGVRQPRNNCKSVRTCGPVASFAGAGAGRVVRE